MSHPYSGDHATQTWPVAQVVEGVLDLVELWAEKHPGRRGGHLGPAGTGVRLAVAAARGDESTQVVVLTDRLSETQVVLQILAWLSDISTDRLLAGQLETVDWAQIISAWAEIGALALRLLSTDELIGAAERLRLEAARRGHQTCIVVESHRNLG